MPSLTIYVQVDLVFPSRGVRPSVHIRNVWGGRDLGYFNVSQPVVATVASHETVVLVLSV